MCVTGDSYVLVFVVTLVFLYGYTYHPGTVTKGMSILWWDTCHIAVPTENRRLQLPRLVIIVSYAQTPPTRGEGLVTQVQIPWACWI